MGEFDTKSESDIDKITELTEKVEEGKDEPQAELGQLYTYLDDYHKRLFAIGVIGALCIGPPNAMVIVIIRHVISNFSGAVTPHQMSHDILKNIWWIGGFPVMSMMFAFIYFYCFYTIGQKTVYEYKWRYLKALLQQDTEWYDQQNSEELPSKVNSELKDIEFGSGKAFGFILFAMSLMIANYAAAFYMGAVFACCMLIMFPVLVVIGGFYTTIMVGDAQKTELRYRKSGAYAEQAIGSIKVVKAFGQEERETKDYNKHLNTGNKTASKQASMKGLASGLLETLTYILTFISLFIGATFCREGVYNDNVSRDYRMGDIFGVFNGILLAITATAVGASNGALLSSGLKSCYNVNQIIQREPKIKIDDPTAEPVGTISEDIEFTDVTFSYKTRNYQVLKGVSLTFKRGEMTALVGVSGSGKSTIVKLLERFYDPDTGTVSVNGKDLRNLNLREYRNKIGYVGQEPFLFNQSIKENLLNAKPDATDADIDKALKDAMAYEFIQKLPQGINSDVGSIGSKISGGQKQRIAIARALLRQPEILILDEATSALDKKNERSVQRAIDRINKEYKITTVVIAHRLSTIKDANMIYCFERGRIVENGSHDELMGNSGPYANFYNAQGQAYKHVENALKETAEAEIDDEDGKEYEKESSESVKMIHSDKDEEDTGDLIEKDLGYVEILERLYKYNRPKEYLIFCFFGVILVACGQVCIAIPQMKLLFAMILGDDHSHQKHETLKYSGILIGMGLSAMMVQWVTRGCMAMMTQNMMKDVRTEAYDNLIHQPIEFYDKKENATGNLTGILAADMKTMNGAAVENYLLILQGFTGIICSVVVAFVYSWPIGIVCMIYVPICAFACYHQMNIQIKVPTKNSKKYQDDKMVISESIVNQSTVASLACDEQITKNSLKEKTEDATNLSAVYAFTWFTTNFFFFVTFMVIAWKLRHSGRVEHMFIALSAGLFGNTQIGVALQNAPDWTKGRESANKIIRILECPREGTPESKIVDGDRQMTEEIAAGDIEFKGIWFKYPTSSGGWILKNFNLKITAGESIGLAGESGCGKSTLIQLLLRFYTPQHGVITISGIPINTLTLKSLRGHYGLVQQEPLIFNTTIMDNICYGRAHATVDEIKQATQIANASKFINELNDKDDDEQVELVSTENDERYRQLGDGYRVVCGVKGSKLSGGQKQRIAIARAVVRNPKILMLDEATSALDESSQAVVQEALDKVMKTATSLVIAHRLSTLSKCDRIVVIMDGVVIEDGTFVELKNKNGVFAQYIAEEHQ